MKISDQVSDLPAEVVEKVVPADKIDAVEDANPTSTPDPDLLKEIRRYLDTYIFLKHKPLYLLTALWDIGTHLYTSFDYFGYQVLSSPQPQCGKSNNLDAQSLIVYSPGDRSVAQTPATIFRDAADHTQIIDEWDECSEKSRHALTSILNGGFQLGATVTRSDEAGQGKGGRQSNKFNIYSPKIIAMVGNPEDLLKKTTLDRAFRFRMERQTRAEKRKAFRRRNKTMMTYAAGLKTKIETWAKTNRAAIEKLYLDRASSVSYLQDYSDRTQDISESLSAILDTIAPNDLALRGEFVEALNLTRKESVTISFELELYIALAELAEREPDGTLKGTATELTQKLGRGDCGGLRVGGLDSETVWKALRCGDFTQKSVRLHGESKMRYVLTVEELKDRITRYGAEMVTTAELDAQPEASQQDSEGLQ